VLAPKKRGTIRRKRKILGNLSAKNAKGEHWFRAAERSPKTKIIKEQNLFNDIRK